VKKKILVYVDEGLLKKFRHLAFMKFRKLRGPLSRAVEEAMEMWVRQEEGRGTHTFSGTQINAKSYQKAYFETVSGKRLYVLLSKLYEMFGNADRDWVFVYRGLIVRLIKENIGHHPRTIARYIERLMELKVLHKNGANFDLYIPQLKAYFSKGLNGYMEEDKGAGKQG